MFFAEDTILMVLLLAMWWYSASRAGKLVYSNTVTEMSRWTVLVIGKTALSILLLSMKVGVLVKNQPAWAEMGLQGALVNGAYLALLTIAPAVVIICTLPRLFALLRLTLQAQSGAPTARHRRLASAPQLVVPLQAAAAGMLLCCCLFVIPQIPMQWKGILLSVTAYILLVGLQGYRRRRRHRTIVRTAQIRSETAAGQRGAAA
ncbi:hypothetical protein EBB07_34335 [Paenibacillaceae bacterium]|nr:hypothetical protein EBB07_34335 [Paenibacillaceae bacterium]